MEDEVRALLPLILALCHQEVTVEPLAGGLTNRNYRVATSRDVFVLRIPGANTTFLGIDRHREAACTRMAAAAGIGPEVIDFLPEHAVLVTRFLPGRLLTPSDTQQSHTLRRVVESLRRFHGHPVPAGLDTFSPFATVRDYHALASARQVPLPADLDRALELLAGIEEELRTDEPLCLCHNDLSPNNFIDDGSTLRIIDWEYAGLGDRFFDLGNLAVNHQFNEGQEQTLLACYFGEARPEHLRRLRGMRLASDMREALWGYLQAGVSQLHSPAYYLEYGRTHLERFLAAATKGTWLCKQERAS